MFVVPHLVTYLEPRSAERRVGSWVPFRYGWLISVLPSPSTCAVIHARARLRCPCVAVVHTVALSKPSHPSAIMPCGLLLPHGWMISVLPSPSTSAVSHASAP